MTDKILVITSPDDILLDGIRILHVSLTDEHSQIVSAALMNCQASTAIINYVWKMGDPVSWLLDKQLKSDIIIFNAHPAIDGAHELIIGYIAAQSKSYYFGTLRDLQLANDRVIYTSDDILFLLEKIIKQHG